MVVNPNITHLLLQDDSHFERPSFKECADEMKIDLESDFEVDDIKCLFKCSMEKEGLMKGGLIDVKAVEKMIREEEAINEMVKPKAITALPDCMEKAKEGDDCQKALDFTICMMKVIGE